MIDVEPVVEEDGPTAVGSRPRQQLLPPEREDLYADDLYGSVTTAQVQFTSLSPPNWPVATGEIALAAVADPIMDGAILTHSPIVIQATPRTRSPGALLFTSACIATMMGGLAMGWAFFAGSDDDLVGRLPGETAPTRVSQLVAAEAPPEATTPAPSTGDVNEPAAADTLAATPAPASSPMAVDVPRWSLEPGTPVAAPLRGEVHRVFLARGRRVRKGEKLFELKRKRSPTARERELGGRVAELEKLAAADPVYRDFLTRARRDLRKEQKAVRVTVTARSAGWIEPLVRRGQRVDQGDALAAVVDPRVRIGAVTLAGGTVALDWSCAPSSAGARVACRIAQVADTGEGQVVSLRVEADRTGWSGGLEGEQFVLIPPAATAGP